MSSCFLIELVSVTIEYELDTIFPDPCFCLFRSIFGRFMLIDDVIVNVLLFTGSYSIYFQLYNSFLLNV